MREKRIRMNKIDWSKIFSISKINKYEQCQQKFFIHYIEKIKVTIGLPKADIGPRKAALLKVAHSCMIHQTIEKQPEISIDLA